MNVSNELEFAALDLVTTTKEASNAFVDLALRSRLGEILVSIWTSVNGTQ